MLPDKVATAGHVHNPRENSLFNYQDKTRQNNVCYTSRLKIDDNYNLVNHWGKINHYIIRMMMLDGPLNYQ
jgi:hypothetical protein